MNDHRYMTSLHALLLIMFVLSPISCAGDSEEDNEDSKTSSGKGMVAAEYPCTIFADYADGYEY